MVASYWFMIRRENSPTFENNEASSMKMDLVGGFNHREKY
jgi:hypothetical protein